MQLSGTSALWQQMHVSKHLYIFKFGWWLKPTQGQFMHTHPIVQCINIISTT